MSFIGPLLGQVVPVDGGHLPGSHLAQRQYFARVLGSDRIREDSECEREYLSLRRLAWMAQRASVWLLK